MPKSKTIADIQLLRAVAVLMVLGHHSKALFLHLDQTKFLMGLWAGVDLFFCISGLVIARILLRRLPESTTLESALRLCVPFWVARFWRIMPAACFWLSVMVIKTAIFSPDRLMPSLFDAMAAVLQVANLHFYHCEALQSGACGDGGIYWTLSLEFQFYLLLPLLLLLCPRCYLVPALCAALLAQLVTPHAHWQGFLGFIRTESFIIGVLIAIFQNRTESIIARPVFLAQAWRRYAVFSLLVLLVCVVGNQYIRLIPNAIALTAIVSGALVFIASHDANYLLPDSWLKRVLLWIGDRSYSIYLLHPPILPVVWWAVGKLGLPVDSWQYYVVLSCAGIAAIVILAEFSYRLIKQRFRK